MRRSSKLLLAVPRTATEFRMRRRSFATDRPYSTAIMSEIYAIDEDVLHPAHVQSPSESRIKEYHEIPGPRELPIIGNAWRFAPVIGQYKIGELDKVMWSLYKDYGRIVKVGGLIGHPDLLFVFNGDDIKTVFRREETLPHRPSMPSLHYYKQHLQKSFFHGNAGVIGVHGPEWDSFRKQVQQLLLPPSTARQYLEPLDAIATEFVERMESILDKNRELPDNFLSEIYKWALESVARVSLDTRLGCLAPNQPRNAESQRIIDSINTFFWNVAEVELKMPVWRVYKNKAFRKYIGALEDFRVLCMKYITQTLERMQTENRSRTLGEDASIVEKILYKTGNPKLAAVLALDLMLVGVDTTSIALASTIYQLSQNPDKQAKLQAELESVLAHPDSKFNVKVQENIPYLRACIKETLRMYPVIIGNGRSLQSEAIISGFKVPKGTHVIFPHLVVSNSTEYFQQPDKFIPERWLTNTGSRSGCPAHAPQDKIHPFVSLPFGYGRRSCLGRRFAEAELQIILAKIFRKYYVEYKYEPLTYKITPTYVPEQPLKFKLTPRT